MREFSCIKDSRWRKKALYSVLFNKLLVFQASILPTTPIETRKTGPYSFYPQRSNHRRVNRGPISTSFRNVSCLCSDESRRETVPCLLQPCPIVASSMPDDPCEYVVCSPGYLCKNGHCVHQRMWQMYLRLCWGPGLWSFQWDQTISVAINCLHSTVYPKMSQTFVETLT